MKRKYIAVIYDEATQINLRKWCAENDFDLSISYSGNHKEPSDFEFHTTIIYSENAVDNIINDVINVNKTYIDAIGFDLFGENADIPVLLVKSESLNAIRKCYENIGLVDYWPIFSPHISLTYAKNINVDKLLPTFSLSYDKIVIEDLEE